MLLVKGNLVIKITNNQPAFACSKSTGETQEQGIKHPQNQQDRPQADRNGVALESPLPSPNSETIVKLSKYRMR